MRWTGLAVALTAVTLAVVVAPVAAGLPIDPSASDTPVTLGIPATATVPVAVRPAVRRDATWPRNPPWDACPAPAWRTPTFVAAPPTTTAPGAGRRVLFIGDSLTRDSRVTTAALLRRTGWTATFRCWGSRRLDWGLDQVSRARSLRQLPSFVVVALGTNDVSWESETTTAARVSMLIRRIGPNRQILWVNLHITRSTWLNARADWFNDLLDRWDRRLDNFTVVDWHKVARAHRVHGWDGIHYGPHGFRLRASTVARALDVRARALLTPPNGGLGR